MIIVASFCALCTLLILGKVARARIRALQLLYLPSSVIAGLIGLLLVQVFMRIPVTGEAEMSAADYWTAGWDRLPGFLINIVFAALFLGVEIPPLRLLWRRSAPQLAYGQIVAWGQYVVGLGLVLFLLGPLFDVPNVFGAIVPVGFEGGHGTAAGLSNAFAYLGWPEGRDFGLASATAGIVSAIIVGIALINWAARKNYVSQLRSIGSIAPEELAGLYPVEKRPSAGSQTTRPESVDSLALHLAIIGVACLIGYLIKQLLILGESGVTGVLSGLFAGLEDMQLNLFDGFPLFPLCMIGGLVVQITMSRVMSHPPVDRILMQRLGGAALDFLVVAAIATIRLEKIAEGWLPFVVVVAGGILWNVFCVMWLARRLLPDSWFERAIAEMGQSMGVTATGLLLLRAVDPEDKTVARSAFGYKQLLHEPFMGGGLWTSSAVILTARAGGWVVFGVSIFAIVAWLVVWRLFLAGWKSEG